MLQQEIVSDKDSLNMKILIKSELKVKVRSKAQFIDKLLALNENQILIYFDTGEFELYDFESQMIIQEGKLTKGIRQFYQIYPNNICYLDPQSIKVNLFDFESGKIDKNFTFDASQYVQENSDAQKKEAIVDKYRVIPLDGPDYKYLICLDLQKHYSNDNTCTFILRSLPKQYEFGQIKGDHVIARYDYPNRTQQTELFNFQVDEETVAIYGQDFETGQAEILLCKPHLGERAFKIIQVKDTASYTLINVTNWYEPHKIALWQNNNDGNQKPTIFVLDMRGYYDGQKWLIDPEYTPTAVPGIFGNIPETFMDIYSFPFNGNLMLQFKLIGVEPKLSLINVQERKVIDTYSISDFYHELPQNRSYLLQFNDQQIQQGYIYFNIIFSVDARYRLLQLLEYTGVIEQYGEHNIIEIFESY